MARDRRFPGTRARSLFALVGNTADDACVKFVCERFRLKQLSLVGMQSLTPSVVDIILASPSSQTLEDANISYLNFFGSGPCLRMVTGCASLLRLDWEVDGLEQSADDENIDAIIDILRERGGKLSSYFSGFEVAL